MYKKTGFRRAMTLLELVVAMAMITVIFAVVLPQFALIRNSWDSKQAVAEALQNGRVLMDHFNHNLSKAVRITDVSASSDTAGYIEFEDDDGNTMRYDIAAGSYVEYGSPGNLSDLAGPVSLLRFTCYDACDLDNPLSPVTDANDIRVVKIDVAITNSASIGQDKTFTTWVYLRINGQSQSCWSNQDIGSVAAAGSAGSASCVWTIDASGGDIWNNTDEFHYVYQALSGNGQIIARVVSVENTDPWAKAGVMIRETLTGPSKHAMMIITPGNGAAFQRRTSTGGASTHTAGGVVTAPYWVKLIRSGNTITGYESTNGSVWTLVGSDTVTMATDVYVGLAVTSHNDGTLCTAVIDNVSFSTITYETFNEAKTASETTSLTISTPATSTGDLLIAAVATDGDASGSLSPPAGWTAINVAANGSAVTLGAWWRLAASSEPATHQFTWTGNRQAYGWMMRFTSHDSSNPINAVSAANQTSITPASPAVTSTVSNCMILRLGAFDDGDIAVDSPGLTSPLHTPITMDKSSVVLFQDGFETDFAKWTDGGATDWDRANDETHSGTRSAHAGDNDNDLISDNINTAAYDSFTVEFWYFVDDIDDGDNVYLQLYDGSYHDYFEVGDQSENNWYQYQATITGAQYLRANFRIKFEGSSIDNNENLWIDDVIISAAGVSGGAGYLRQSAAGSSGTSNFSLVVSQEARMLTIAIAPNPDSRDDCCGDGISP